MFKYTSVSMEDLADDIGDFTYSLLVNTEKLRPIIKGLPENEQRKLIKDIKDSVLDRLRAYEG